MIVSINNNNEITEITCDICGTSFTMPEEIDEFMRFDYEMGETSSIPGKRVKFDVCQDCMIDAFPSVFSEENKLESDLKDLEKDLENEVENDLKDLWNNQE